MIYKSTIWKIHYEPWIWSEASCQPFYRCLILYCGPWEKKNFLGRRGFWLQYLQWPLSHIGSPVSSSYNLSMTNLKKRRQQNKPKSQRLKLKLSVNIRRRPGCKKKERKKKRKEKLQGQQKTVSRNVSPFYRVKERKYGGLERGEVEATGQDDVEDGEESSDTGLSWRAWGERGGWDLCGCKMGLFPPLWDSSCKLAPHTFNWADIYTVAQKQASFSAAASHPSPSASQAQSKVKSIFFKTGLSLFFHLALPPARPPFLPLGRTVKYIIDFLELRTPDWESAGCKDLDQSPGFNLTPPIKLSGDPLTPHSAQRSIPQAAADILFFFLTNTQSLNKV